VSEQAKRRRSHDEAGTLRNADRARLRYAAGRRVDPTQPLFDADSLTRQINRHTVLLLAGGRALLLQIAHPLVAAGVAAHSRFEREPLRRLWRTLDLTLTIVFGSAAAALRAVRGIERAHASVQGRLAAARGPFARGTPYDAGDPRLQFWVHATLVDSALVAYQRFVAPLSDAALAQFYEESRTTARLFGIPDDRIPPTYADFRAYWRGMLRGRALSIGPESRAIADALLSPALPFGLRHAAGPMRHLTIGLLPPDIRRRYGYSWQPWQARTLDAAAFMVRTAAPFFPSLVREFPHARRRRPVG